MHLPEGADTKAPSRSWGAGLINRNDASLSSRGVNRGGSHETWLLGAGPACCFPPLVTGKMYTLMAAKIVKDTEPPLTVLVKHRPSYEAIKQSVQGLLLWKLMLQKMVVTVKATFVHGK